MEFENTSKENLESVDQEIDEPLTKPIKVKKPRPPKTEKQMEQFQNAKKKRDEALKKKKEEKELESAKLLLSHGYEIKKHDNSMCPPAQELPSKKKPKQILSPAVDESSSEEDEAPLIIVKKKKKKKPKTIVIEESESDEEEEPSIQYIKKRDFVSQQNKKSVIKVHKNNVVPNYFV